LPGRLEHLGGRASREAYAYLVEKGVEILRATNHVTQRSIYFADPDGNVLEIYYELPHALELFPNGPGGEDEHPLKTGRQGGTQPVPST
jgi:hypothetical protein